MAYLKPLRRKIGVLMLVIACVFAAGWVRSSLLTDTFDVVHEKRMLRFDSRDGKLSFAVWKYLNADIGPNNVVPLWQVHTCDESAKRQVYSPRSLISISRRQNGNSPYPIIQMVVDYAEISYGLFVIPLTLLSAWLLLSKPRQPKLINGAASK